jgi:hypothetical protein
MREIRLYGSEGGGAVCSPYPYLHPLLLPKAFASAGQLRRLKDRRRKEIHCRRIRKKPSRMVSNSSKSPSNATLKLRPLGHCWAVV